MAKSLADDVRDLQRIAKLYQFAFDPERLLSPTVLPETYYPELLRFVGKDTDTPHIILRQQTEWDKTRLVVVATHNIDRANADNVTSVHKSSSPMIQKLGAVKGSYYSPNLGKDMHIAATQRRFLLELGVHSAIYTPIYRNSELRATIAYFRHNVNGFTRSERNYFMKSLAGVIELIYGFADRLYELNNQLVNESRDANSLLAAFSSSFHEAKGYFSNPLAILQALKSDIDGLAAIPLDKRTMLIEGLEVVEENLEAARDLVYEPLQAQERPSEIPCLLRLIRQAAQPLQRKFTDIEFRFTSEIPEPISFFGREAHLKRLFFNLILNALQATRQALAECLISGGLVEIQTRAAVAENALAVTIRDNGIGIPPEFLSRVFDRGFSTWRDDGGTGLGLYLARRTVEGEGGELTINSKLQVGTTVTVTLPMSRRGQQVVHGRTHEEFTDEPATDVDSAR